MQKSWASLFLLACALLAITTSWASDVKPVPRGCYGKLVQQAQGCHDCGILAFINTVPWTGAVISEAELRMMHESLIIENPSVVERGLTVGALVEAIHMDAHRLSIYPEIADLSQIKAGDRGILLLARKPGEYGHYVSLIETKLLSVDTFRLDLIDPVDPKIIHSRMLYLQPDGSGRLDPDPEDDFDVVEPHLIRFD